MSDEGETRTASRWPGGPWLVLIVVVLLVVLVRGNWRAPPAPAGEVTGSLELADMLSPDSGGFAQARRVRAFAFPQDHGPHPDYRSEWWYVTANVVDETGRRFGVQLTFFRFALSPKPPPESRSAWTTRQAYMAHFAVSDVDGGGFYSAERFDRGALGLAGARAAPLKVWLHGWAMTGEGAETFPMRLEARSGGQAIDLTLFEGKPRVLQGEKGLSRKSARPGNASYYYSYTRLPVRGRLSADGEAHEVSGLAWLDREWSTSALDDDQVGWDWFAVQLDDGRDLMYYQLRRKDGSADPLSAGVVVDPEGGSRALTVGDVDVQVTGAWRSPAGGVYPSGWRLKVPSEGLELRLTPLLSDQEHRGALRYWEGAVEVTGTAPGGGVGGRGYVELTGYAEASPPS